MSKPREASHSVEEMLCHLRYDAETGKVFWIKNGKEAGHQRKPYRGCHVAYRMIQFRG